MRMVRAAVAAPMVLLASSRRRRLRVAKCEPRFHVEHISPRRIGIAALGSAARWHSFPATTAQGSSPTREMLARAVGEQLARGGTGSARGHELEINNGHKPHTGRGPNLKGIVPRGTSRGGRGHPWKGRTPTSGSLTVLGPLGALASPRWTSVETRRATRKCRPHAAARKA